MVSKKSYVGVEGEVSPDDAKLFRESVGSVVPVDHDRVMQETEKPRPIPKQTQAGESAVLQQLQEAPFSIEPVETGDELSFLRSGLQKQILRKLKRGQYSIQDELDLHGMTVKEAKPIVQDFLNNNIKRGVHAVRIIHGKGRGSRERYPVLKNKLNKWLQLYEQVLAFCSARPVDGGTGAIYVLLKHK
ncbi:MAG: Smr/MutS family endonuclease [Thiotrichales bacterium]|nr:Smr/MutS family endonuclease [Thiotrichales bacterium]